MLMLIMVDGDLSAWNVSYNKTLELNYLFCEDDKCQHKRKRKKHHNIGIR